MQNENPFFYPFFFAFRLLSSTFARQNKTSFMRRYLSLVIICLFTVFSAQAQRPGKQPDGLPVQAVGEEVKEPADSLDEQLADTLFDSDEEEAWDVMMRHRLDKVLDTKLLETSDVGLMVWDLTADSCLYRYNARRRMRPASTQKVITAVTALDRLGGDYRLTTTLCYRGIVVDSTRTLIGDLWCVGGMDPKFDNTDLAAFVRAVKQLEIDTIRGNLYADLSFKDRDHWGEGWCWDDENPELTPLLLNGKDDFLDRLMRGLREARIYLDVQKGEKDCPVNATQLCTRSHALSEILKPMMKDSNNLFAECLFYQIAHRIGGNRASAKAARTAVAQVETKAGADPKVYRTADGSGLSLYNYVSAELEVKMLRYAYLHDDIYDYLEASLPIAGVDGTLSGRMGRTRAARNVRAKSGTLTGVSSLAGYCSARNGHLLCFAIINQGVQKVSTARAFQDRVCVALCQ